MTMHVQKRGKPRNIHVIFFQHSKASREHASIFLGMAIILLYKLSHWLQK